MNIVELLKLHQIKIDTDYKYIFLKVVETKMKSSILCFDELGYGTLLLLFFTLYSS